MEKKGIDNQMSHLIIYVQSTHEVEDGEEYICDWALQRANGSGSLARNRRMEWARETQPEPQGVGAAGIFRRYHEKEYRTILYSCRANHLWLVWVAPRVYYTSSLVGMRYFYLGERCKKRICVAPARGRPEF